VEREAAGPRGGIGFRCGVSPAPLNDDAALLRRYVDERDESAFTEVVRRHIDLVQAVAQRRSGGDPAVADATVQAVFSQFAAEAASLRRQGLVVAFLHLAALGQENLSSSPSHSSSGQHGPSSPPAWDLALDRALAELPVEDRAALLLHYAERREMSEVGVALDLSAEAAALRVSRALDKLRAILAGRGTRIGVSNLRELLSPVVAAPVPAGRVEQVARTALAHRPSEHDVETGTWFDSLVGMVNSGVALGIAALLVAGTTLAWGYRTNLRLEGEISRLHGDNQTLASLQRDNRRLARLVTEAEELRREAAELPALRAAVFPGGPQAAVGQAVVTIAGPNQWRWDNDEIPATTLAVRLGEFRQRYPAPESMIVIRANGVRAADVLTVLEAVRRAEIARIQIEGEARFEGGAGGWLF
jgi:DNA-directed RNA polymerase specialized sigma24 family protein/biopolymer transport protein ExbD